MSTQENLDIVKKGFAAFGSGNLPGLLELMAENVEWEIPGAGLRLAGTYRGPQGVASFFQKLADDVELLDFQPRQFLADGEVVLVVGSERTKVKATGRIVNLEWVMAFTVRDGKVTKYRQYYDTKLLASAYESTAQAAN